MTEMDRATGADADTVATEMDRVKWSIYSGDPGVDSISSHLRPSYNTMNYTMCPSHHLIALVPPGIR